MQDLMTLFETENKPFVEVAKYLAVHGVKTETEDRIFWTLENGESYGFRKIPRHHRNFGNPRHKVVGG